MSQVVFRSTDVLIKELDNIVESGYFRSRTEAINEAVRLLLRRYSVKFVASKIDRIKEKTKNAKVNLTKSVIDSHEEE